MQKREKLTPPQQLNTRQDKEDLKKKRKIIHIIG